MRLRYQAGLPGGGSQPIEAGRDGFYVRREDVGTGA